MRYNRKEAFRYQFGQPLNCLIKVVIDEKAIGDKKAEGLIYDLSPRGLKCSCPLDLPENKDSLMLEVGFVLNDEPILIRGEIRWKKPYGTNFLYGLLIEKDHDLQDLIIRELKLYSKNASQKSRTFT